MIVVRYAVCSERDKRPVTRAVCSSIAASPPTIPDGSLKSTKAKAKWSTRGHTGAPVPLYALGPNAEWFAGVYDNTEISQRLASLLDIRPWPQQVE